MADALDSKSSPLTGVSVQVRSPVLQLREELRANDFAHSSSRTGLHPWQFWICVVFASMVTKISVRSMIRRIYGLGRTRWYARAIRGAS
jgi:hypothetical protein